MNTPNATNGSHDPPDNVASSFEGEVRAYLAKNDRLRAIGEVRVRLNCDFDAAQRIVQLIEKSPHTTDEIRDSIQKAAPTEAAAVPKSGSFPCLIPDTPITKFEQLAGGATTMGLGRGIFRNARILLRNGRLSLSAVDAYDNNVTIADVQPQPGGKVVLTRLGVGTQLKTALQRTVITGLGVGVVIAVLCLARMSEVVGEEGAGCFLLFLVVAAPALGMVLAALFTFLPALSKTDPGLRVAELPLQTGEMLVFALRSDQIHSAKVVLEFGGLAVEESQNPN